MNCESGLYDASIGSFLLFECPRNIKTTKINGLNLFLQFFFFKMNKTYAWDEHSRQQRLQRHTSGMPADVAVARCTKMAQNCTQSQLSLYSPP